MSYYRYCNNGHSKGVIDTCRKIKTLFTDFGSNCEILLLPKAAIALARLQEPDAVKVVRWTLGSIAATRIIASGGGVPQLSASFRMPLKSVKAS